MASRDIVQNLSFRGQPGLVDAAGLSAFLEKQYLKANRAPAQTQKVTFSPSSIGGYNGLCPRYWYMAFKGAMYIDNNDAIGIANMANGTAAHSRIEGLFKDSGANVELEVEARIDDPPVRGFIDLMIEWDNEILVGEVKTTRQEVFMIRQTTMKPSAQHLLQVLLYLKATGNKRGFLLYENKNSQEFLVIPVEYTEQNKKILNEALDWMRLVYKNYQEGELPTRPFTKKNKNCKGCPIFDECWSAEPGTVTIAPMEVPKL